MNNIVNTKKVTDLEDHSMGPLGYSISQKDREGDSWWLSRMLPGLELPSILKPIKIPSFSLPKLPFYTINLV